MRQFKNLLFITAGTLALTISGCSEDRPEKRAYDISGNNQMPVKYQNGEIIPGQYIAVYSETFSREIGKSFKKGMTYDDIINSVKEAATPMLNSMHIPETAIIHTFGASVKGFAAKLNAKQLNDILNNPNIASVEPDRWVVLGNDFDANAKPGGGGSGVTQPAQTTPWGVTRVGNASGSGKTAWIIDTGVEFNHPDLNVNQTKSKSFVSGAKTANDGHGHGTHVAGTIAAKNNSIGVVGVAYDASVVAVKVLSNAGSGTTSGVIKGVDYVAANAAAGDAANMSLGGGVSTSLDNAVASAASKGIWFSLAAGNEGTVANNSSPARVNGTYIVTISAMDNTDNFTSWSNYGQPPVDYIAPGASILSTYKGNTYATMSGTSMATPHVTGLLLITGGNLSTNGSVYLSTDGKYYSIAHK
jgi:subtilisin family serine protease